MPKILLNTLNQRHKLARILFAYIRIPKFSTKGYKEHNPTTLKKTNKPTKPGGPTFNTMKRHVLMKLLVYNIKHNSDKI